MKVVKKAYDLFFDIIKYLCVVLMIIMVLIVAYCVFMRYVMNSTPRWGDEMALFCMIWFCLLSASWAYKENRHIRIDLWQNVLPANAYKALQIILQILTLAMFCILAHYAMNMFVLVGKTKLSGSGLPMQIIYFSEPVTIYSMIVAVIGRLVEIIGKH